MCSIFDLVQFDEELGDFTLLEDQQLFDGSKLFKLGLNDVVSDLKHDRVVHAHQQHLRWLFVLGRVPQLMLTVAAHVIDNNINKPDEGH